MSRRIRLTENQVKSIFKTKRLKSIMLESVQNLLEQELQVGQNLESKLKFINNNLSNKILNFLKSDKIKENTPVIKVDLESDDDKTFTVYQKDRNGNIKKGKQKVQGILKYLGANLDDVKQYEIEELISFLKKSDTANMKIVSGKDILWGYNCKNYDEGEDMGSCMRYEEAQKYLDIYVDNPDKIQLIVLTNPKNGAIRGRALLWTLDSGSKFMDRVYVTNNQYRNEFNNYANSKGFEIGNPNNYVTLSKARNYNYYPYLDTFFVYVPDKGVLMNDINDYDTIEFANPKSKILTLRSSSGKPSDVNVYSTFYRQIYDINDVNFVNHLRTYIPKEETIFSKRYNSYLFIGTDDYTTKTFEDETILEDDAVTLYDGKIAHIEDTKQIDDETYVLRHTTQSTKNWIYEKYGKLMEYANIDTSSLHNKWWGREAIKELKNVKYLKIYGDNESKTISNTIGELINLEQVNIIDCNFKKIPKSFNNLTKLKYLTIESTPIKTIIDSINKLKKLEILYLRDTFIPYSELAQIQKILPSLRIQNYD